ncbi:MAG: glutamate--tRNA ligase [Gammaproteobacteria bacterium]
MAGVVRTRFAPSPTGDLHIGGVRTALFSWLYAKHCGGEFLLRVEDTDQQRSSESAIEGILQGLHWLGLEPDQSAVFQSQNLPRHQAAIRQLLEQDKAYRCYCSKAELDEMREQARARGDKPRYDGRCRNRTDAPAGIDPVIRFKTPLGGEVLIDDLIQGQVVYQNQELDDLIIARSDDTPTYNLTVVVDDRDMGISHVIRGDDHLNNTPRQIHIFHALDSTPPHYAHLPLILGADGKKLSKRDGTAGILAYREQGFLPRAVLNYLLRLGWSHGDQELFSLEEMIELFDISDVNKSAAALNPDKLDWVNQHYMQTTPVADLLQPVLEHFRQAGIDPDAGPPLHDLLTVQKERVKNLAELTEQSRCFYQDFTEFIEPAAKKHLRPVILPALESLHEQLTQLDDWDVATLKAAIDRTAEQQGLKLGKIAQPLRVAVTGTAVSPSIDATLVLLGKDRVLSRLALALDYIRKRAA